MQPNPNDRRKLIERLERTLTNKVRTEQSKLYARISKLVDGLDTQDGVIRQTTKNLLVQSRVNTAFTAYAKEQKKGLIPWLLRGVLKLLGLSRTYFKTVAPLREGNVYNKAVRRLFLRLGVDKGQIIPGSWLDSLASATNVKASVMGSFQRAIMGRVNAKDFNRDLAQDFIQVGVLVKDVKRVTRDLFISVDREVQNVYKQELGLGYGLWSGTVKATTTDFCKRRSGLVFTEGEINRWNGLQWSGKLKTGHDCKVNGHGYGCRHHVSWITKETAEAIAKRRGKEINSFNA